MSREILDLKAAAEHVHLTENELRHFAQRGEIEAVEHAGGWHFAHRVLDEWAQRNLLASSQRDLAAQHRVIMDETRQGRQTAWAAAGFLRPEAINLSLSAKAKSGIIRDMTDLADRTSLVYDSEALFKELVAREEVASTAIGAGIAFLHPRFHDPYLFQETFIAYGRSERIIFFGAPNGEGTRHFFLICSTDHEEHLHILARLAMLAHGSNLTAALDAATSTDDIINALQAAEKEYIP